MRARYNGDITPRGDNPEIYSTLIPEFRRPSVEYTPREELVWARSAYQGDLVTGLLVMRAAALTGSG